MINFRKLALNQQKSQIYGGPLNAWKYAWKHENKTKRRDRMILLALREENLAKIEENDKKFVVQPCQVEERRKVWKELLKKLWISQRTLFKKAETRCSIDRKTGSINRTRQRLIEFLKQDFDWSKIRLDQLKF